MKKVNTPKNVPDFACGHCRKVMCTDCLSIAAEYEYLRQSQVFNLIGAQDQIKVLQLENAQLKRSNELLQESISIPFGKFLEEYTKWKTEMVRKEGQEKFKRENAKLYQLLDQMDELLR